MTENPLPYTMQPGWNPETPGREAEARYLDAVIHENELIAEANDLDLYEEESRCPYCGEYMSYCQGHGEIGDPDGFIALQKHDDDNHEDCHPNGCEVLRERQWNYDHPE